MGLPMYREASSAAPKSALKSDPSAHARSSIRRRGAVRHVFPRASGSSVSLRSPRAVSEDSRNDQSQRQNQSTEEAILDAARNGSLLSDYARREVGSRLLRDALRHGQPGRRLRIPRESSLRFEIPSPPWSVNDFLSRTSPSDDVNNRQTPEGLPFTPRFAPAFAFQRESSSQSQSEPGVYSQPYSQSEAPLRERSSGTSSRHSRLTSHYLGNEGNDNTGMQRSAIDGLGDRQRSASPDDDQDDAWETLLTTITPDANLPSADSSFASTAASASTNPNRISDSARSVRSPQTQSTSLGPSTMVHMILEPYPEYLNPCDFPDLTTGSDTEAESDFDLRTTGSRSHRRTRSRFTGHTPAIGSTQDSQPPPVPRFLRTSTLPSISSLISQDPSSAADMQAIVDRLLHREDIPDEWWAAAGLSRSVGRRLGVGDEFSSSANDNPTRTTDET